MSVFFERFSSSPVPELFCVKTDRRKVSGSILDRACRGFLQKWRKYGLEPFRKTPMEGIPSLVLGLISGQLDLNYQLTNRPSERFFVNSFFTNLGTFKPNPNLLRYSVFFYYLRSIINSDFFFLYFFNTFWLQGFLSTWSYSMCPLEIKQCNDFVIKQRYFFFRKDVIHIKSKTKIPENS